MARHLETPARRYPPDRGSIQITRRGKALRDRMVLRVIAIDRLIHFLILTALGIGMLAIAGNADALRSRFYRVPVELQNAAGGGGVQSGRHGGLFHALDNLLSLRAGRLRELGIALAKRLFGVRGFGKVDEDLRARDTNWQAIERATPPAFDTAS